MKLEKRENFNLAHSITDLNQFINNIELLKKNHKNLIIKLDSKLINNDSLILSLVNYSSFWKTKHNSFILVVGDFSIKNKNLVCVPTLDEAIDYLFMEELERNV